MKPKSAFVVSGGGVIVMAGAGFLLVWLGASKYGAGLSPDSVHYVACARSLAKGRGFVSFNGNPFSSWPPLYPALLSVFAKFHIALPTGVRFMNAAAFSLTVILSARFFALFLGSSAVLLIAVAAVLFSLPLLHIFLFVWSDPVFALLVVATLLCLASFCGTEKRGFLISACLLGALSCLQRYLGVTIVLTGAIVLLTAPRRKRFSQKATEAAILCASGYIPLFGWMVHNLMGTGTLAGGRAPSSIGLGQAASSTWRVISTWFISPEVSYPMRGTILAIVLLLLFFVAFGRHNRENRRTSSGVWIAGIFFLVYTGFIVASSAATALDPLPFRYMAAAYIPGIGLFFYGIEQAVRRVDPHGSRPVVGHIAWALAALWLIYPASQAIHYIARSNKGGPGYYTQDRWMASPLAETLEHTTLRGKIFSNAPELVYLFENRPAVMSPNRNADPAAMASRLAPGVPAYLVWFKGITWRQELMKPGEISSRIAIHKVRSYRDGAIYRIGK